MRRLLYLLSGLFLCVSAMAQGVIRGQVTSKAENKPLSNVTVSVKGTTRSTETDQNGNFSIEATKGETLLITSVGYTAVEVKVGSGNVNVSLEIGESRLDEVVVTAMGIKKERKALGYSVTELNAEELMKNKNTNVVNSLTGKVPGVNVTQFSGAPGAGCWGRRAASPAARSAGRAAATGSASLRSWDQPARRRWRRRRRR